VSALAVSWSSSDNLSGVDRVACKDMSGAAASCTNSLSVTATKDGSNAISVVLTDKAGNSSQPFMYTWLLDTIPPVVTINLRPAAVTGSGAALSHSVWLSREVV